MLRDLPAFEPQADIEVFMNASGTEDEAIEASIEYVDPLDDVFGSAPTSPTLTGRDGNDSGRDDLSGATFAGRSLDHPSDISRLRRLHVTNGYREGIAASKETHIQAGFDEGYSLGAEVALKAGYLLGAFEGLCSALPRDVTNGIEATTRQMVQGLSQEAEKELSVEHLFGSQYFGEDGVWKFEVQGEEAEVTFTQVAEAHPIIKKCTESLRDLCAKLEVAIDYSSKDGESEAKV
jgi:hypothetical protein